MCMHDLKINKVVRSISVIICCAILCSLLSSCVTIGEKTYYKNEDNYITVTDKISYIRYDDDCVYLRFEGLSEKYQRNSFRISGKNFRIASENGIEEKIELE